MVLFRSATSRKRSTPCQFHKKRDHTRIPTRRCDGDLVGVLLVSGRCLRRAELLLFLRLPRLVADRGVDGKVGRDSPSFSPAGDGNGVSVIGWRMALLLSGVCSFSGEQGVVLAWLREGTWPRALKEHVTLPRRTQELWFGDAPSFRYSVLGDMLRTTDGSRNLD